MRVLASGSIAFGSKTVTGWQLTDRSFPVKSGSSPMAYDHWESDNYIFSQPATWIVGADGVTVFHWLDLARAAEFDMYTRIESGYIGLSYGIGATPTATRSAMQRVNDAGGVTRLQKPRPLVTALDHWSYTPTPAIEQQPPVRIIQRCKDDND